MKKMMHIFLIACLFVPCLVWAQDDFNIWKKNFINQAIADKISSKTLDKYFTSATYLPKVIEADRKQPEFTLSFAKYMQRLVTPARVQKAKELQKEHRALLSKIEKKYNVPSNYLLAFWALETNFGQNKGDTPIVSALATLAYDERRSEFFTAQLLTMLHILQEQGIESPVGSWAGAFGHFQFMPSTFHQYAVDENADGVIDVSNDLTDAFGSAAHYLSKMGWQKNVRWGREVLLTNKEVFNHLDEKHPLSFWSNLGVLKTNHTKFEHSDDAIEAQLVLPQGAAGKAFLVYKNFNVIKRWNNSDFYALAVGVLADKIANYGSVNVEKIPQDQAFSRNQIKQVQKVLAEKGLYSAKIDGSLGKKTKNALKVFQKQHNLLPDGFLSEDLFMRIVQNNGKDKKDE